MLDNRSKNLIRALLYPVQFEQEPEAGVARAFEQVVAAHALDASEIEYLGAIERALESDEQLSSLIPQSREEKAVRAYLASMQKTIRHARAVA
jgi:hypothetical protein